MLESITNIVIILCMVSWFFYGSIIFTFTNRKKKSKQGYPLFYNTRYFNCKEVTVIIDGCNKKTAMYACYFCKYSTYSLLLLILFGFIISVLN